MEVGTNCVRKQEGAKIHTFSEFPGDRKNL